MLKYSYYEAVKEDVLQYIRDEINFSKFDTLDELGEYLNETLWEEDSVTGNGSGSYNFSAWESEENLCHNLDLLEDALTEYGKDASYLIDNGPEAADVIIRCYMLSTCVEDALAEVESDFDAAHEESEEE